MGNLLYALPSTAHRDPTHPPSCPSSLSDGAFWPLAELLRPSLATFGQTRSVAGSRTLSTQWLPPPLHRLLIAPTPSLRRFERRIQQRPTARTRSWLRIQM